MKSFFLGLYHLVWFASIAANAQQCDICGGNALPETNLLIIIGDATIASCQESLDPTFCSLLDFFDGFTCGAIQFNPALAFEFCELFQVTLGVACNCNIANPITDPIDESVGVPTEAPTMLPIGSNPLERATVAIIAFFARIFVAISYFNSHE